MSFPLGLGQFVGGGGRGAWKFLKENLRWCIKIQDDPLVRAEGHATSQTDFK